MASPAQGLQLLRQKKRQIEIKLKMARQKREAPKVAVLSRELSKVEHEIVMLERKSPTRKGGSSVLSADGTEPSIRVQAPLPPPHRRLTPKEQRLLARLRKKLKFHIEGVRKATTALMRTHHAKRVAVLREQIAILTRRTRTMPIQPLPPPMWTSPSAPTSQLRPPRALVTRAARTPFYPRRTERDMLRRSPPYREEIIDIDVDYYLPPDRPLSPVVSELPTSSRSYTASDEDNDIDKKTGKETGKETDEEEGKEEGSGGFFSGKATWIVLALVVTGLVYASQKKKKGAPGQTQPPARAERVERIGA